MTKRIGGTSAKSGFYWNLGEWEMTMIPKQGGLLPGDAGDKYLKVPVVALLVLAPVMGAGYALFLPCVGFALLFSFLGKKAYAAALVGVSGVAATMGSEWRPGEAYLAGKKKHAPDAENGDVVDPGSIGASVQGKQTREPRRPDLHD
jgi:hypothetical protein